MDHPDQTAAIQRIRNSYPTPLGEKHAQFLIEMGIALNVFLLRKDSGTNITLPNGVKVSQDIIVYPDREGFDVLSDGEGAARPTWIPKGQIVGDLVDPRSVGGQPQPEPQPEPSPSGAATADLQQQQIVLLLQMVAKFEEQNAALTAGLASLRAEIAKGVKVRF